MNTDDDKKKDEDVVDLRGMSPKRSRKVKDDVPEPPAAPASVKAFKPTPFGDVPLDVYDTFEKFGSEEGISLSELGEAGIGKLLIFTGIAVLGAGILLELLDRAVKANPREAEADADGPPEE